MPVADERGPDAAVRAVRQWFDSAVLGLGLCPFAAAPARAGRVRVTASTATDEGALLADLERELLRLDASSPAELETTLLVVEAMLGDFADFNAFLDLADALLRTTGREGIYQVASFHPRYRFAGTVADDVGNLTNCSPWPVLHVLREASVARALGDDDDTSAISARNIKTVRSLSAAERRRLFHWW